MFNQKHISNIHLIGIGGISMSAIAEILINNGFNVSGSDISSSNITDNLITKGARIYKGHSEENMTNPDLVIYSAAVNSENPEMRYAKEHDIQIISRAEALGQLMKDYKYPIAISGTHGKTTTTSLTSLIFQNAEFDPTVLVGGNVKDIGGNLRLGKGDFMITEACEYKDSFLSFLPKCSIILNIEEDHLDYFDCLDDIVDSFSKFSELLPKNGYLIVNNDDYNAKRVISHSKAHLVTFGITNDSTFQAINIKFDAKGNSNFDVLYEGEKLENFYLNVPGRYNIYNALASIACAYSLGAPLSVIKDTLKSFKNADRRFEFKGKLNEGSVVEEYAHHPSAIKASLTSASNMDYENIYVIFQPHTYSRTKELFSEFSVSFMDAKEVIITDIYSAGRETNEWGVDSSQLVDQINLEGGNAKYIADMQDAIPYLKGLVKENDLLVVMGAGDINKIIDKLV